MVKRFDLGILFVHGIGEQEKGATLQQLGEPMYGWIAEWLQTDGETRASAQLRVARLHGGGAALSSENKDDVFSSGADPAYAELELTLDSGEETRWLLAESWWAADFSPPSPMQVARWTFGVVPWLMLTQTVDALHPDDQREGQGLLRRIATLALHSVSATFLLALALPAALVVQAIGVVLVALAFVPQLQRLVGGVQRFLGRSIGDSYSLLTSPMSLAAMVTRVRDDLEWLCQRSRRVALVSHSQGAALSHRVLRSEHPENAVRLITVGQAIGKLEALEFVAKSMRLALWVALIAGVFALGFSVMFVSLLPVLIRIEPDWVGGMLSASAVAVWVGVLRFLTLSLGLSARGLNEKRRENLGLGRSVGGFQWHDLYGSVDPVSNGPMFLQDDSPRYTSKPIRNSANIFKDHTAYPRNRDTFWPAVMTALPLDEPWSSSLQPTPSLAAGAEHRRQVRVTALVVGRLVLVATTLFFLWWSLPYWSGRGNSDEWCWSGLRTLLAHLPSWLGGSASTVFFKSSSDCLRVPAGTLGVLAAYALVRLTWGLWDANGVRVFMSQKGMPRSQALLPALFAVTLGIVIVGLAAIGLRLYSPPRALPATAALSACAAFAVLAPIAYWRPYQAYRRLWLPNAETVGGARSGAPKAGRNPDLVLPLLLCLVLLYYDAPLAGILEGTFFTVLNLYLLAKPKGASQLTSAQRGVYEAEVSIPLTAFSFFMFAVLLPGLLHPWWLVLTPVLAGLFVCLYWGRRSDPRMWIPEVRPTG